METGENGKSEIQFGVSKEPDRAKKRLAIRCTEYAQPNMRYPSYEFDNRYVAIFVARPRVLNYGTEMLARLSLGLMLAMALGSGIYFGFGLVAGLGWGLLGFALGFIMVPPRSA